MATALLKSMNVLSLNLILRVNNRGDGSVQHYYIDLLQMIALSQSASIRHVNMQKQSKGPRSVKMGIDFVHT